MLYRQNMSIMLSMSKKYGRKSSNWAQKPRTKQRAHKFYESLTQTPNCRNELFCAGPRLGVRYHWTTHRAAAMFWAESWILRCMKIWNGDLHEKKRSTALGEECVCVVDLKALRQGLYTTAPTHAPSLSILAIIIS